MSNEEFITKIFSFTETKSQNSQALKSVLFYCG
jgi:hypothetical protein